MIGIKSFCLRTQTQSKFKSDLYKYYPIQFFIEDRIIMTVWEKCHHKICFYNRLAFIFIFFEILPITMSINNRKFLYNLKLNN